MTAKRTLVLGAVAVFLVAGGLRLYRLGDWPFHTDELATVHEVASFEGSAAATPGSPYERLPRLIPLSYATLAAGYGLFGNDELGSRLLPAMLGTLFAVLVFCFLDQAADRRTALATALLIAFWPEHVERSQENRFYMIAALLAALCMLGGAMAVQRRSRGWVAFACVAGVAALLAHVVQALLWAGLFAGIAAAAWCSRDRRLAQALAIVAAGAATAFAVFALYQLPLARGWNAGEAWGYSSSRALLACATQLGWPVLLLAGFGALCAGQRGTPADWYWLSWAGLWVVCPLALPHVVVYHPAYSFPFALAAVVLAGVGLARIYEALSATSTWVAAGALAGASLLGMPSLLSHYSDGSRADFRASADYVRTHWTDGDRVAAVSSGLFKHYVGADVDPLVVRRGALVAELQTLAQRPGRLWIVVDSHRSGKSEDLTGWLDRHCARQFRASGRRFDYYENVIEVYLFEPPAERLAGGAW